MQGSLKDGTVRILRVTAIAAGALLILAALLSDLLGLSAGSLSRNQIAFMIGGLLLVLSGFLGRKFPAFYRGTALILLNVVIAVLVLEFLSIILVKLIDRDRSSLRARKIEEGHLELAERTTVVGLYAPFVEWRSNPALNCDTVNVDRNGYRITPGASSDPDAYEVFLLGGSSMWGLNVGDSCTIGAYMQRMLTDSLHVPVSVRNLAQVGYTSTQEVVELMLQLRSGNVPDLVIHYNGFNDIYGAYQEGRAGSIQGESMIAARVEGRPEAYDTRSPLEVLLEDSNTWLLVSILRERNTGEQAWQRTGSPAGFDPDSLAREVIRLYLGNCGIVDALASRYGFEYAYVWQPTLWYGNKPLTPAESLIVNADTDPAFRDLCAAASRCYDEVDVDSLNIVSFAGILDGEERTAYSDFSGAHVYPWVNEMIAGRLLANTRSIYRGEVVAEELP